MMRVPKIKSGVMSSISKSMSSENWIADLFAQVVEYDITVAEYIAEVTNRHGEIAAKCALIMYKIIDSQLEANEMDKDFI